MKTILKSVISDIQQPKFFKSVCCIIFIMVIMLPSIHAQGPSDLGGEPGEAVPIDGGLSLLVAAGVGYGAKKMKDRRQNAKN
jgi:hypothetical protein